MAKKASYDPLVRWMLEPDGRWTPTNEELELEIEERKLARQLLRRRDNILKAVYLFTEGFLRTPLNDSSIKPILEKLGHAAEISRVYIFKNHTAKDGTLLTSQRWEWTAPDIDAQHTNPELYEFPWIGGGFERWVKAFGQGELIYGFVNEFPQKEQEVLAKQSIISIMAAPIFVGNTWWGFIGFDECLSEREWSPIETEALKIAANIIGAAIQRRKAEQALVDSEKKYRLVVENATEGIVIAQDKMLKFVNSQTKRFTGYSDKELAAQSFLDFVHPDDREMVKAFWILFIQTTGKWLSNITSSEFPEKKPRGFMLSGWLTKTVT
jgi:GAF domain-containing protein